MIMSGAADFLAGLDDDSDLWRAPTHTQSVALERTRLRWAATTAQRALQAQPRRPSQASPWHSAHALLATPARTAALAQVYPDARNRPGAGGPCTGGVRSRVHLLAVARLFASLKACPAGQYKGATGPAACVFCPANTTTAATASTTLSACVCEPGYVGPAGGPCVGMGPALRVLALHTRFLKT